MRISVEWIGIECELSNPRIAGEYHESAKPHPSGLTLCPKCGQFMENLNAMVAKNRTDQGERPRYVAGKHLQHRLGPSLCYWS